VPGKRFFQENELREGNAPFLPCRPVVPGIDRKTGNPGSVKPEKRQFTPIAVDGVPDHRFPRYAFAGNFIAIFSSPACGRE
jgi:hypothetical protein